MTSVTRLRQHARKGTLLVSAVMLVTLLTSLLSACGGNPQAQQQASTNKAKLDALIVNAQSIGVPAATLQPIIQQEKQLSATSAPFALFNDQPVTDYYTNMAQRYQLLAVQVQGLVTQSTQQLDYQASQTLQKLEAALAKRQAQNFIEAKTYSAQLTQDQNLLAKAQYPKDYLKITSSANQSIQALNLMGPAYDSLTAFQQLIGQLQASHIDTTALNAQYQQDLQSFRSASAPGDYAQLIDLLNVQWQASNDFSTQAIPYVGAAKLQLFNSDILKLKSYGQSTTTFQQKLNTDQNALNQAKTISDYLKVSSQIDKDIASLQSAMTVGYATSLLQQFHQEVTAWGNSHQYHDPVDGGVYNLDYEYDSQGIGSDADSAVQYAQSTGALSDYQAAESLIQNDLVELHAMEADYNDKTPYNQPHATDFQMMQHYNVSGPNGGQVLVVSLVEQTLRYYNNGKLVRAFYIVSGQYAKPSPPGFWSIVLRQSPTVFKSSEPQGSAFWYPDTNIQYALEYHYGGYFFHDAWWRGSFGPGDNFPHNDPSGTTSFNGNGSHGCINMAPSDIAWLYPQIGYGVSVILY